MENLSVFMIVEKLSLYSIIKQKLENPRLLFYIFFDLVKNLVEKLRE